MTKATIIHGDCLEELKNLDDNSIDAVICDPPYGLSNTKPQQVADVLKAWVTGDTSQWGSIRSVRRFRNDPASRA